MYLNGTLSGTTNDNGRYNLPGLLSGNYSVEVRKTGYVPVSKTIRVITEGEEPSFELAYQNADLTILLHDKDQKFIPNASVSINNILGGMTDEHGQFTMKVKINIPYNISVAKEGYHTVSVQKEVALGCYLTDSVTVKMEKTLDWGLVVMIVLGAICILVIFIAIRRAGRRKRRHVMRRD